MINFAGAFGRRCTNQDGTPGEKPIWLRVSARRKLGEVCNQYLGKGHRVLAVGRVSASTYTRHDGQPVASLELTASTVRFLGGCEPEASNGNGSHVAEEGIPF